MQDQNKENSNEIELRKAHNKRKPTPSMYADIDDTVTSSALILVFLIVNFKIFYKKRKNF
jgi:hypothetical protein